MKTLCVEHAPGLPEELPGQCPESAARVDLAQALGVDVALPQNRPPPTSQTTDARTLGCQALSKIWEEPVEAPMADSQSEPGCRWKTLRFLEGGRLGFAANGARFDF